MNPALGWALVALALVAGYAGYGWRGMVLALTVIVFWLLLQFGRTLRTMRRAAGRPVGETPSAVMLQARLREGMTMLEVLPLAGSLGRAEGEPAEERWRWRDGGGASVALQFQGGRLRRWQFEREPAAAAAPAAPTAPAGEGGGP